MGVHGSACHHIVFACSGEQGGLNTSFEARMEGLMLFAGMADRVPKEEAAAASCWAQARENSPKLQRDYDAGFGPGTREEMEVESG